MKDSEKMAFKWKAQIWERKNKSKGKNVSAGETGNSLGPGEEKELGMHKILKQMSVGRRWRKEVVR